MVSQSVATQMLRRGGDDRRRSLTERGPRSKAERRARSTRSRTCGISPARTSGERSRESSECLEAGEPDSTSNVRYQLNDDALVTHRRSLLTGQKLCPFHCAPLMGHTAVATMPDMH